MEYIKQVVESEEFKKQFEESQQNFKDQLLKLQFPFIKIAGE